jgi:hypothetical protein
MTRLKFILLILSLLGCTSTGPTPTRPSYPLDERKAMKNERKRRRRTGFKRQFKNPK